MRGKPARPFSRRYLPEVVKPHVQGLVQRRSAPKRESVEAHHHHGAGPETRPPPKTAVGILIWFCLSSHFPPAATARSHPRTCTCHRKAHLRGVLLPPNMQASATGLSNFSRILAGSFGTSLSITLWDRRASYHCSVLAGHVSGLDPASLNFLAAFEAAVAQSTRRCRPDRDSGQPASGHVGDKRDVLAVRHLLCRIDGSGVAGTAAKARSGRRDEQSSGSSRHGFGVAPKMGQLTGNKLASPQVTVSIATTAR